jgi:4-nitrophenyl phosphatase
MPSPQPVPIKALILDMDGVLWRNTEPLGDLPSLFSQIERQGWRMILATNNATRTPEQYAEKLASFGVKISPLQVINSSQTAALYLKQQFPKGGAVFFIGEEGLRMALQEQGFYPAEPGQDFPAVLAVVAGMDRTLTYDKLRRATLLIRAGAPFIGTNPDLTFPTPEGLVPGAGAILAAIEAATGQPPKIMGKPEPEMYRAALERMATSPAETLVVGDRLETDIVGGQALGCQTALVLSGVTTPAEASAWRPRPDYITENLTALLEIICSP